jgi:hypothetical protein
MDEGGKDEGGKDEGGMDEGGMDEGAERFRALSRFLGIVSGRLPFQNLGIPESTMKIHI